MDGKTYASGYSLNYRVNAQRVIITIKANATTFIASAKFGPISIILVTTP